MHTKNKSNCYVDAVGRDFIDAIPKAVLAAIAISALTCGGDTLEDGRRALADEWRILHQQGIVPQAPNRTAKEAI